MYIVIIYNKYSNSQLLYTDKYLYIFNSYYINTFLIDDPDNSFCL